MKKMTKRFMSLLTVFAVICTMLVTVYAADPEFVISIIPDKTAVAPGDSFEVDVALNNAKTLRAGQVFLKYDADAFTVKSYEIDSEFPSKFPSAAAPQIGNETAGLVKLAFANGTELNIDSDIMLFKVEFEAKNKFGKYGFDIDSESGLFAGSDLQPSKVEYGVDSKDVTITADDDATLRSLSVSAGTLDPDFDPDTLNYDLGTVSNSKSSLVITAVANNPGATIKYNGSTSNNVSLSVGDNTISIVVTPVSGADKTYTLTVYRAAASSSGGGTIENTIKPTENKGDNKDDNKGDNEGGDKPDEGRPSDKFTDLAGYEWAIDHIDKLLLKGIVNGTSETTFEPGADVTRAQFAKMIVESFGLELKDQAFNAYIDVKNDDWFKKYVDIASQNGIVNGYPNGTFLPNAKITREEMCVMLARALASFNLETKDNTFADKADMSDWAVESINLLSSHGVIVGKGDNNFAPKDYAIRAESAVVISRIVDIIEK